MTTTHQIITRYQMELIEKRLRNEAWDRVKAAHDRLSEEVEDPDGEEKELRRAAISLCVALAALYEVEGREP